MVPNIKIDNLINHEDQNLTEDLDRFEIFTRDISLLNNLGILNGSEYFNQILEFFSPDEMFVKKNNNYDRDVYEYEKEKLISHIYFDRENSKLYKEILRIPLKDCIDKDELEIIKLTKEEVLDIRKDCFYEIVHYLLVKYMINLEEICFEYSLRNLNKKIDNVESILVDSKISLYSPLLFSHETWKKIILNELINSNSFEALKQKKNKFLKDLTKLKSLFPNYSDNLPLIDVTETDYWFQQLNNEGLLIFPLHFWLAKKQYFLESLGNNKLERLYNKELVRKYNLAKKTVKKLKLQLKRNKLEIKQEKYIKPITRGLVYLLSKENPNLQKLKLNQLTEQIISNLFYFKNIEQEEYAIDNSFKISNTVLIEFIIFLRDNKRYLVDKKISIPRLISDNLNYDSKGFSYQNLSKIYNATKPNNEFKFNGTTSTTALSNEMK